MNDLIYFGARICFHTGGYQGAEPGDEVGNGGANTAGQGPDSTRDNDDRHRKEYEQYEKTTSNKPGALDEIKERDGLETIEEAYEVYKKEWTEAFLEQERLAKFNDVIEKNFLKPGELKVFQELFGPDYKYGSLSPEELSNLLGEITKDPEVQKEIVARMLDTIASASRRPIVIDLNEDGRISLTDLDTSGVLFDTEGDGTLQQIAWVSPEDGFLVIDSNNDGKIIGDELIIADRTAVEDTDLEALSELYDNNNDGVLDNQDAAYSQLKIWQDSNQDGVTDPDELKSLDAWGIKSISLISDNNSSFLNNNLLLGTTYLTKFNGEKNIVGDVALRTGPLILSKDESSGVYTYELSDYFKNKLSDNQGDSIKSNLELILGGIENNALSSIYNINAIIDGKQGDDIINGGSGNDWIFGGEGSDSISGGAGNDILVVDSDDLNIDGGEGHDTVIVSGKNALVLDLNVSSIEKVIGNAGNDQLSYVGNKNIVLEGRSGDDTLISGNGNDWLSGGAGSDSFSSGGGNDVLFIDADDNAQSINAGAGSDWVIVSSETGVTLDLHLSQVEYAAGNKGVDTFTNQGSHNVYLSGKGGDDFLTGGQGNDVIQGGEGSDTLNGLAGFDLLSYRSSRREVLINLKTNHASGGDAEGDVISNFEGVLGSSYNDILVGDDQSNILMGDSGDDLLRGGAGADFLNGEGGVDTVSYHESASGVNIDLSTNIASGGDANGDKLVGFESIIGSAHADKLTGDNQNNSIEGGAGADTLTGAEGVDTIVYTSSNEGVVLDLEAETATGGHAEEDIFSEFENAIGSSYDDVLKSQNEGSFLSGLGGNDNLIGRQGNDVLEGGAGADNLDGGSGYDTLSYENSDTGVEVNLEAALGIGGHAEGDTFSNFENIQGSYFSDTLIGDSNDNVIEGDLGEDIIDGKEGVDTATYEDAYYGVDVDLKRGGGRHHDHLNTVIDINRVSGDISLDGDRSNFALHQNSDLSTAYATSTISENIGWITTSLQLRWGDNSESQIGALFSATHELSINEIKPTNKAYIDVSFANDTALIEFYDQNGLVEQSINVAVNNANVHTVLFGYDKDSGIAVISIDGNVAGSYLWNVGLDVMAGTYGTKGASASHANVDHAFIHTLGLLTDEAVNDTLINIENLRGSENGDRLAGDDGDNVIEGNGGNDILKGYAGDDTLDPGKGADIVDGGEGIDTAVFLGEAGDYSIVRQENDSWIVRYIGNDPDLDDGENILTNIERLKFSNQVIDLQDLDGNAPIALRGNIQTPWNSFSLSDLHLEASNFGTTSGGFTFSLVSASDDLSVTIQDDGKYNISTVSDFEGERSFTYRVTDASGKYSESTVIVNNDPANIIETVESSNDLGITELAGNTTIRNLEFQDKQYIVWSHAHQGIFLKEISDSDAASVRLVSNFGTRHDSHQTDSIILDNGNVAVSWIHDNHAYVQVFDITGAQVSSATGLGRIDTTSGNGTKIPLAKLENGNFVTLSPVRKTSGGYEEKGQIFSPVGEPLGGKFELETNNGFNYEVLGLKSGGFVLAWVSKNSGTSYNLYAQKYNKLGELEGDKFTVGTGDASAPDAYTLIPGIYLNTENNVVFSGRGFSLDGINILDTSSSEIYSYKYGHAAYSASIARHDKAGSTNDIVITNQPTLSGSEVKFKHTEYESLNYEGTTGADVIYGSATSDQISAGLGNDFLSGRDGSDTYIFNKGDGQDTIDDNGYKDVDRLVLHGYSTDEIILNNDGSNLIITFTDTADKITIINTLSYKSYLAYVNYDTIEEIVFDDGTTWTIEETILKLIEQSQTDGNDNITGFFGDDVLEGGLGNDTLNGREGADTYVFNRGDGQDTIKDDGSSEVDKLVIHGYSTDETIFTRSGSTLTVSFTSSSDKITIYNTLRSSRYDSVDEIVFDDGTVLNMESIRLWIIENRLRIIEESQTDGDDFIKGFDGQDTLEGGLGNDTLHGYDGSDTYIFNKGDGQDIIEDRGRGDTDKILVKGYTPSEVTAWKSVHNQDHLILTFDGTDDQITVYRTLSNSVYGTVEQIVFDDGTIWAMSDLANDLPVYNIGDDIINGNFGKNTIDGGSGNDVIDGKWGDDLLTGGIGDDTFIFAEKYRHDRVTNHDTITDFVAGAGSEDSIRIEGLNISTFDAVLQISEQVGDDTVINFDDDNSITLNDVQKTALHADDFQFV